LEVKNTKAKLTFWDFCAPFYDVAETSNREAWDGMCRLIRERVPSGASVLEIAAGTGSISFAVADKAENVVCTDVSERMLIAAKRKAKKHGVENVTFRRANIYETGFADGEFDVVIAAQVLHLLDDPERAAAEIKRIAKTAVITPVCLLKKLKASARFKIGVWRLLGFAPKHEFDEDTFRAFLAKIGLEPNYFDVSDGAMPLAVAVYECGLVNRQTAHRQTTLQ